MEGFCTKYGQTPVGVGVRDVSLRPVHSARPPPRPDLGSPRPLSPTTRLGRGLDDLRQVRGSETVIGPGGPTPTLSVGPETMGNARV